MYICKCVSMYVCMYVYILECLDLYYLRQRFPNSSYGGPLTDVEKISADPLTKTNNCNYNDLVD